MLKGYYSVLVIIILLFAALAGCAPKPSPSLSGDGATTCILGTVSYKSPVDSSLVPYPSATVSAWKEVGDKPLSEAVTNQGGKYCIEIPVGVYKADLRVWGMVRLQETTYICQGAESNFEPGETPLSCGEDCKVVDIVTECKKRIPGRR